LKDLDEEGATNTGTNLFVTGIHPRLKEEDVIALFDKYGEVENCSIMLDPHTKESRGFGFVKMATTEQADAAKEGLQGENIGGRTLSIEKARRNRPRTPTPGRYFGPPKRDPLRRDDRRGGGSGGGFRGYRDGYSSRYDDDRRGGYGRRDDHYRRDIDRYASDRYDRRDDRGALGDKDHDGVPNAFDRRNDNGPRGDRDHDGVPNAYDRNPNNSYRR